VHTWVLGQLSHSLGHAEELLEAAQVSNTPSLKAQAHAAAGEVLVHQGDLSAGLEHLKSGLGFIASEPPDSIPAQNAAVACAAYASWATSLSGASDEANKFVSASKEMSRLFDNPFAEAIHCALCADTFLFEGKVEDCLRLADRAVEISREQDFPFWLGSGLIERSWALAQRGELAVALESIDEGIAVFEATGARVQLANWYGVKAETLLRAGRMREGLAAARHALACAERTSDMFFVPRIHAVAALAQEALGAREQASRHLAQARSLAEGFGMTPRMITLSLAHRPGK
jgi:tetratricopeptide (TPR) repeat protein